MVFLWRCSFLFCFFPSPCGLIMLLWLHSGHHNPDGVTVGRQRFCVGEEIEQSWGLKPEASPAGTKSAAVHDTCSPKKLLFASFQSFSPSISLFLFQATRSFPPLAPPPLSSEQVIPQRASFKPFTYSPCCFLLQLSQTPTETLLWVTTRETSVPRAGSTNRGGHLKEMPKDWKTVKKVSCWGRLLKILSIKEVWQHCAACSQVQK